MNILWWKGWLKEVSRITKEVILEVIFIKYSGFCSRGKKRDHSCYGHYWAGASLAFDNHLLSTSHLLTIFNQWNDEKVYEKGKCVCLDLNMYVGCLQMSCKTIWVSFVQGYL